MSLFFAPQTVGGRPVLVQFRAGTMNIDAGTATADKRKGFASLIQNTSGLLELWWQPQDPTQGSPVQTIITFGDATFDKVDKCTTGTVFALCLNGSKEPSHTRLFWLQEPNTREEDILTKIKKLVGDAQCRKRLQAASRPAAAPTTASTVGPSVTSNATATAPAPSAGSKGPITNEALQAILQNLTRSRPADINLQQLLSSDETLAALREDPAYYMQRIGEHLPPNHSSDIVAEIRNPQAVAAAATLQAAVSESPNTLNEVLGAFGLPKAAPTAAATATALCEAIIKASEANAASPAAPSGGAAGSPSSPTPDTK